MPELWAPVEGYLGHYEVSNEGRVRSIKRIEPLILKVFLATGTGYPSVSLWIEGKGQRVAVHRLVALAFVPGWSPGLQVRHMDGDRTNNNSNNLQWGTQAENEADKRLHGTNVNANKLYCPLDHEYTPENTRVYASGSRACRACARLHAAKQNAKRRARRHAARI